MEAADEEIANLTDRNRVLLEQKSDLESELKEAYEEEPDWTTENVGLCTFQYKLTPENLKVTQQVESFVSDLKRTYIGVTA